MPNTTLSLVLADAPVALVAPHGPAKPHLAWVPPDQRFVAGRRLMAHAWSQMGRRKVPAYAVEAALTLGRRVHVRSAVIHALGRNEVSKARRQGLNLSEWEGLQVVVLVATGAVATVYRNRDLSSLKAQGSRMAQASRSAKVNQKHAQSSSRR